MFKFFRQIRRHLVERERIGKYLVYAIGEIILVVIGILIAIQLNNAYKELKDRQDEVTHLEDILKEFVSNRDQLEEKLAGRIQSYDEWDQYIKDIAIGRDTLPTRLQLMISYSAYTFNPSVNGINILISTGDIHKISNDSIRDILFVWPERLRDALETEKLHTDFANNQLMPYEQTLVAQPIFKEGNPSYPFTNEATIEQQARKAYTDVKYLNLLKRNFFWVGYNLNSNRSLLAEIESIIVSLESEIKSLKGD